LLCNLCITTPYPLRPIFFIASGRADEHVCIARRPDIGAPARGHRKGGHRTEKVVLRLCTRRWREGMVRVGQYVRWRPLSLFLVRQERGACRRRRRRGRRLRSASSSSHKTLPTGLQAIRRRQKAANAVAVRRSTRPQLGEKLSELSKRLVRRQPLRLGNDHRSQNEIANAPRKFQQIPLDGRHGEHSLDILLDLGKFA
jgi:hypothetical protein